MVNLLEKVEWARLKKTFSDGLSKYEQANCNCTLTDDGYRIYSPPNITYSSSDRSTRTMWGGVQIIMSSISDDVIVPNHKYIILFHVQGQTTRSPEAYMAYSIGWATGGGLTKGGLDILSSLPSANFNGEMDCFYQFTVGDSITMAATKADSGYVVGNLYNIYRQFKFGFDYGSTGELGTDLYVTNFRMYDITDDNQISQFYKNGIIKFEDYEEITTHNASIQKYGSIYGNNFIEI